ncbi:hypothetical protein KBY93_12395 [Synechococcus sp. J7-Johnson]|uniref:hypothetical protein n=1 Tax=Synechococcus sp. J7-Johnson TaxID=2823737 RepID=UPI0020CDAD0F|nr:hypothetical protein [Synechococcus sp. J7-Johnson]MCP9841426.1 hypothetical protein [Synechococcus sp. J7-Johnson]
MKAEQYKVALDAALKAAGQGGPNWNVLFWASLAAQGLALQAEPPSDEQSDLYPDGRPLVAPRPYEDWHPQWPEGTVVVWAPPAAYA